MATSAPSRQVFQLYSPHRFRVMRHVLLIVLRLIILALTGVIPAVACSADISATGSGDPVHIVPTAGTSPDATQALAAFQIKEDRIRQRASTATSDVQLIELDALSRRVADDVDRLIANSLQPDIARTHAQLDVLGAAPATGAGSETPAVTQQRDALTAQQARLGAEVRQAEGIRNNLVNVNAQITRLLHEHLKDQLALRTDSVLSAAFWTPFVHPDASDYQRLRAFGELAKKQLQSMWEPGRQIAAAVLLLGALASMTIGARFLER